MFNFICYPRCTTCKKAQKWLEERGLAFETRDIKAQNPNEDELREWAEKSGLPLRRFFNTSGIQYRALSLSEKLDDMNDNEKIALLATDGMLVKRPILLAGDKVLVGFKQEEWEAVLGG